MSKEGADYAPLITKKSFRKNLFFGSWPSFSMNTKFCTTNKSLEQTKFFLKFEQNNLGQTKSFELDLLFWLGGNMLVINIFSCLAILIDNFSISISIYYPRYIFQTYLRIALLKENIYHIILRWLIRRDVFLYPIFHHSFEGLVSLVSLIWGGNMLNNFAPLYVKPIHFNLGEFLHLKKSIKRKKRLEKGVVSLQFRN